MGFRRIFIPNYASFTSFEQSGLRFGPSEQMSTIINSIPLRRWYYLRFRIPLTGLSNVNVGFEIIQEANQFQD